MYIVEQERELHILGPRLKPHIKVYIKPNLLLLVVWLRQLEEQDNSPCYAL